MDINIDMNMHMKKNNTWQPEQYLITLIRLYYINYTIIQYYTIILSYFILYYAILYFIILYIIPYNIL